MQITEPIGAFLEDEGDWAETHEGPENEWVVDQARAAGAEDQESATLSVLQGRTGEGMTVKRPDPFTWVTWLPKLMIGDDSCEWAAWFRTHYQNWARPPEDMDWTSYRMEHTSLLRSFRDEIKADWDEVLTEKQNQFYYRHPSGLTLSGIPDLVAIRGDEGLVIDIKSGQPRGSHRLQVMTYMHCLPQSHVKFEGKRLDGLLVYEQRRDDIKNYELDGFTDKFDAFLHALSGETPLTKVPSAGECRFCNIDTADCEGRMSTEFAGEDS